MDTWWIKTLTQKTDARYTERCLGSGRPRIVRIAANINDAEDLVLSQDSDPYYKPVLSLKDDRMNTNCDNLSILAVTSLFLRQVVCCGYIDMFKK